MSRLIFLRGLKLTVVLNETRFVSTGSCFWYSSKVPDKSNKNAQSESSTITKDDETSSESQIFLLNSDKNVVGSMTLNEAQRLAKRKNLTLVKVGNVIPGKHRLENYQLLTRLAKSSVRDEKTVTIGSKITEHDLGVRINSMKKWFSKSIVIRITINPIHSISEAENVYEKLGKAAAESGYEAVQKQSVADGKMLKFLLQPHKIKSTVTNSVTNPASKNENEK